MVQPGTTRWSVWGLYWNTGTSFDRSTSITFGIVVGVEFALAGAGAWFLISRNRRALVPPWIALGVHFFPIAALIGVPMLYALAVLVNGGAIASLETARSRSLATSSVTGVITGSLLLAGDFFSLSTIR